MKLQKRYYTFLYVPESNTAVKTIKIAKTYIYLALFILLAGAFSAGYVIVKYSSKAKETYKLIGLERENEILKSNLTRLSDQLSSLEKQVAQNFDFQKKARILANLDELNEDISEVGVGGPEFAYVRSLSILDRDSRETIKSLENDISKLLRQARFQEDGYREIISRLSGKEKKLNCTPSIRPVVHGFISSRFGRRMDPFTGRLARHRGVDFSVRLGAPILATADGVVTYARRWSDFGNVVEISHGFGVVTRYAHVSKIFVKKGQKVKRGDIIARVGSTGKSTAAHLHYEVLLDGQAKNPLAFILSSKEIAD